MKPLYMEFYKMLPQLSRMCRFRVEPAVWCLIASALFSLAPQNASAGDMEEELLKAARSVLQYSRERGYENIGVLKFRVKKGQDKPTDRVGPLNQSLPTRLELALIMANRVTKPIGIIRNASEVAADIDGASHLNAKGRQRLFDGRYPLAWGNARVEPDAFVVGVVEVQGNLQTMTVGLAMFDRRNNRLQPVAQFDSNTTPGELTDLGESFSTRGLFDRGQLKLSSSPDTPSKPVGRDKAKITQTALVKQTALVREGAATFPLLDPSRPINLAITYNGRNVPIEVRDGRAFVREPQTDQVVTLTLSRRDPSDRQRYAIVLKVNGENTLGRERQQDFYCRKWVLDPDDPSIVVRGYQIDTETVQAFRVLSQAESKERAMDYGNDVGTLSLVVFRERTKSEQKPVENLLADDAEDFQIIRRGTFPSEQTASLDVLKQRLLAIQTRGLIGEGEVTSSRTRRVTFTSASLPVISATITYYRPD